MKQSEALNHLNRLIDLTKQNASPIEVLTTTVQPSIQKTEEYPCSWTGYRHMLQRNWLGADPPLPPWLGIMMIGCGILDVIELEAEGSEIVGKSSNPRLVTYRTPWPLSIRRGAFTKGNTHRVQNLR